MRLVFGEEGQWMMQYISIPTNLFPNVCNLDDTLNPGFFPKLITCGMSGNNIKVILTEVNTL